MLNIESYYMNLNISRITEARGSYKSVEDNIYVLYKKNESFLSYNLNESKRKKQKLVFNNVNHKSMLHKHLVFEHFYIILLLTLLIAGYQLVVENYLMSVLLLIAGMLLELKLLNESEVPLKLVFDGLTIYEVNHIGKRVNELNSAIIEPSNTDEYENDFIFISSPRTSSSKNEKIKSLIIMESDFGLESRDLFRKHFHGLGFKNRI